MLGIKKLSYDALKGDLALIDYWMTRRGNELISRFDHHILGSKILDIGAGTCHVTKLLRQQKYHVVPLDIRNLSLIKDTQPVIYNGKEFPFSQNSFDTALMICMLHHTPDPEWIIREAIRVASRIIIIEDVIKNRFHRYLTYAWDSFLNFEFFGHPHQNKTDHNWIALFEDLGLKLVAKSEKQSALFMWHVTYILEKKI